MGSQSLKWLVAPVFALAIGASGTRVAAAAASDAPGGPNAEPAPGLVIDVATDTPPVVQLDTPPTTEVIVATDDPPVPPTVATGPPPTRPVTTFVSPSSPGTVTLPETGSARNTLLSGLAVGLIGCGSLMVFIADRRRGQLATVWLTRHPRTFGR